VTQVTFTNPAEVAKTRLQLQGELAKAGEKKVYKNVFDVFAKTWRNEGIRGMQRGLGPAVSLYHRVTTAAECETVRISSSYTFIFLENVG
jgi:hypothetical protein